MFPACCGTGQQCSSKEPLRHFPDTVKSTLGRKLQSAHTLQCHVKIRELFRKYGTLWNKMKSLIKIITNK